MPSIPASAIVSVNPSVLSAGGQALDLSGLVLTQNTRVPVGSVLPFSSPLDVASYFGATALEYFGALRYFAGFDNSQAKPAQILFSQYPTNSVAAYLRSGSLAGLTLTALQAFIGTLTLTINGVSTTSGTINLSAATSFSNAATIIQNAFASPSFTVTFDSIANAFLFLNNTAGTTSTTAFATGSLATNLLLTQATGAVLSQGAIATDPISAMTAIISQTTNWASFMTAFDPDIGGGNVNMQLFAQWTTLQNNRYAYVVLDNDPTPTQSQAATGSLGYILKNNSSSGIAPIYAPTDLYYSWFVCGSIASIDFTQTNGNTDMAFKSQAGLEAAVTNETAAANLLANGYNFYGAYATANDNFIWFYDGSITGKYKSIRAYVNQIWLSNQLQLAGMLVLQNTKALPYNAAGRAKIYAACLDPIEAALNFGAIQQGITLSNAQIAEVNSAAGGDIAQTLQTRGWYLQVLDASPQVRANGDSPPINFWYTDGGSVHKLNINSTDVQ